MQTIYRSLCTARMILHDWYQPDHPDTVSYHHYYHRHDHHHHHHHDHHHCHHDVFIWSHLSFKLVHTVPQRVLHLQRWLVKPHKKEQFKIKEKMIGEATQKKNHIIFSTCHFMRMLTWSLLFPILVLARSKTAAMSFGQWNTWESSR